MKREQRQVYLALVGEINWTLCGFCKYGEWYGCCDDACCECQHPIDAVDEIAMNIDPTTDCWAFKPHVNVSDMADIVGLMLSLFHESYVSWHKDKDGVIHVVGKLKQEVPA